ncbi:ATP-dependent sacrificial sulfur transferase LarE [Luteococcus sp. Sow4_B9]|uniref:ATP-dependent sacrificial sulfur transferase LarE n=1 Tax=Luteococcus sp. Sow4_B9 TaxID=3438792 RepID=UPI003F9C0BB0
MATSTQLSGQQAQDAAAVARQFDGLDGRLGIAYSGGVDSAVLCALAVRALGASRVVALLGVSPSLAADERRIAHEVARQIGVEVREVRTHEGDNPAYVANDVDRCFHCKDELFTRIDDELVQELGLAAVAYGENADDVLRPDRPGSRAATRHAVLRPLAEAGITKPRVRAIARELGLSVADKPAAPCLASRIPHGEPVTPQKLRQVEAAEEAVRRAGFSDGRVRHHGTIARIELPVDEMGRLADRTLREQLLAQVREAGFGHVTVDLAGIQSGQFTMQILTRQEAQHG